MYDAVNMIRNPKMVLVFITRPVIYPLYSKTLYSESCSRAAAIEPRDQKHQRKAIPRIRTAETVGAGLGCGRTLKGSWDLVTRVINKVTILIITYNPN